MPEGDRRGTFRTATLRIDTHDFTAENLTIQNDAGYGHTVGQALALYADGDRIYLENCRLIGSQDTLFAAPLPLKEAKPGDRKPPESPDDTVIYGYVTAASTPENLPFGFCFLNCKLTGDCPTGTVMLGRPWLEWAKTVYLNCELGAHIHPAGWADWEKPHEHFYYAEYHSYDPGAAPNTRAAFSRQLTDEEAAGYTMENVLNGWKPGT